MALVAAGSWRDSAIVNVPTGAGGLAIVKAAPGSAAGAIRASTFRESNSQIRHRLLSGDEVVLRCGYDDLSLSGQEGNDKEASHAIHRPPRNFKAPHV